MMTALSGRLARAPSPSSLLGGACALGLALGVKAFYGRAGADDLLWILAPSAWLARIFGGIDLIYEQGAGYISHAHRLVVGPPCAGVNFLVICFLTLYFSFARHTGRKARWLAWTMVISFCAAVAANGLRIFVSAHLWGADIYGGWITPERMHRLVGIVIYYASLVSLYLAVESQIAVRVSRKAPLCWYLGVSLGVPLAGRMVMGGETGFGEHAVWVASTALLLSVLMFLAPLLRNRVCWRP